MAAKKKSSDHQSKKKKDKSIKDGPTFNKASKRPFKAAKGLKDASVKPEALSLQLEDEVPDFPRGGGSSLSRHERDEIHAEVDAEFEAEQWDQKKKRKKMQKKTRATQDDFGSLFGEGISGRLPRYANKITMRNISPGMKLWGVISEVNEKDLVISLPGGLRGLVRMADALDPDVKSELTEMENNILPGRFHVGQLVSCVVLKLDDDKKEIGKCKIWLSLRLSLLHKGFTLDAVQEGMVLTAYVKSIQDHGYILHFGLPSFTGFLLKNDQVVSGDTEVKIGQLLQGIVGRIDKVRQVVYLNCDPDAVSKCVTKDPKGISIDLLVPGMMVNARVKSVIENGVMLSFLTYFTGTVDIFHLQNSYPTTNWKDDYIQNKKVNARILFIDPSTRAIGLTLNAHLVHNKAIPSHVKVGDIYDDSKVVRVDKGFGLLLEIPSTPVSTPAYVSISDVADEEVRKLEKKFKEGSHVRVRVLGFRHLEGIATGILKARAFEDPIFTHEDVKPGMVVRAKIITVDSFGAIVQFPGGVKALCPVQHMSEFEVAKPGKKFKVGAELVFRVLGCKSKRITVTNKKTLVKSKLGILSSYTDTTAGFVTHGWITKIETHGCFVRFYNGVQGFAPRSELGLEPGCDPSTMYHVGQVVKCRITGSVPASRRINLSFIMKPTRVSEEDIIKLGSLVSGVVDRVTNDGVVVFVNAKSYLEGTISTEHLADHHGHATTMKSVLKAGYKFDQLLVLDIDGNNLVLSAKYSLINSAHQLPLNLSQIQPNSVVHGYICNLIETGCFVRFLGRLTAFSPRNKATGDPRVEPSESFYIGQSVRSNILDVNNETGRMTVSLRQSSCHSTDASFIQEYFLLEEKIAKLQSLESGGSELQWVEGFSIGNVVEGKIEEVKDVGVVVSLEKYPDVFGFITQHQLGGTIVETGTLVRAVVLDVAISERLIDFSLRPEFFDESRGESLKHQSHKKKRKRETSKGLEVHQTVNAVVEIVKENYLVLSVPECDYAIGYASISDYNTQKFPQKLFVDGQSVVATVMALPSPSTSGRLLLLLNSMGEANDTSGSKRAKKKSSYKLGSLVQAEITEIKPLELKLKFGIGFRGRVHITEVNDVNGLEDPFGNFRIGQVVTARIVAKAKQVDKNSFQWELSLKPNMVMGPMEIQDKPMTNDVDFSTGQRVTGYVYKVDSDWVWLTISRFVRAQLFILDTSCEPSELGEFQKRFHVGKIVSGHILSINKEKKLLRLVLHPFTVSNEDTGGKDLKMDDHFNEIAAHIHEGDRVVGRISKILPGVGGLHVQIDPQIYGRVHFMELADSWVPDPLNGYHEGQFVGCKVLEVSRTVKGTIHVDLSLRFSSHGKTSQSSAEIYGHSSCKRVDNIEELQPNMLVQGYVKNVSSKGCFILLSRKIDAKILISNLSDGYVDNPVKDFPVGKLVVGRILSVEPLSKRVEVTLKTSSGSIAPKSEINDLRTLHIGEIIAGRIKRIESFGLFITIDDTNLVGLCHVSELSDHRVENIETKYKAGERVTAKILKVDEQRHRISLGMKDSYFGGDTDTQPSEEQHDNVIKENGLSDNTTLVSFPSSGLIGIQNMDTEGEQEEFPVLAQAESRASVPPLEVSLDDIDQPDMDNLGERGQEHIDEVDTKDERNTRQAKKKEKAEREQEIRAAEKRLLENDMPRNADEFEKLVRSSPNSSFVWIKYMAFALSMADVEKARSIAERALKTINIREENEKLNVWVAYFNLENEYGNPPEEAVLKVFQRALQYNDPKKVHLALLGMYERTEQHKLVYELLDKMVKKFRHSCKIWLRRVQSILKRQKQDVIQPVVSRALLSLPRHKHIKFISQTAILEFKCGVPDRGRSMFEGILREYPKRTDLWSVYLDQEIRLGDVDMIRALFERAVSLSLPPKKMKFLFKKYLDYEKSLGDEERIESVKRKAMEYVESTLA